MIVASLLAIVAIPVALIWLLPLAADLASLAALATGRRRPAATPASTRGATPRLCFLVPAHDEALLIERCVRSLVEMERSGVDFDVHVIADNCTDETARIAAAAGARVLERHDLTLRGKPQAILWAMAQLPTASYDAVVIIDADTVVDAGFARALAAHAPLRDKAVQAYFGLSNESDSWLSRLAGLLARVRYEGQYVLKERTGLNCPLTGNGMCLGTGVLARAGWAPESLTENWELYARYTSLGEAIEFEQGARLHAQEAKTMAQSSTQRRRWQAGRGGVLRDYWRAILSSRRIDWHQKLDALSELSAAGPVLHATIGVAGAALFALLPGPLAHAVAAAFALSLLPMAVWTAIGFARHPERGALLAALVRLPAYAVWRLGVAALAISTGRRGGWHRSPRHSPEAL